jgi:hypothetical protein
MRKLDFVQISNLLQISKSIKGIYPRRSFMKYDKLTEKFFWKKKMCKNSQKKLLKRADEKEFGLPDSNRK